MLLCVFKLLCRIVQLLCNCRCKCWSPFSLSSCVDFGRLSFWLSVVTCISEQPAASWVAKLRWQVLGAQQWVFALHSAEWCEVMRPGAQTLEKESHVQSSADPRALKCERQRSMSSRFTNRASTCLCQDLNEGELGQQASGVFVRRDLIFFLFLFRDSILCCMCKM